MADSTIKVGNRHYHLGCTLGVGGFSEVKKGVDSETRKRVALKIMYTDETSSQSELKSQLVSVQKEIKAMKQLSHTNIIRLLGYDLKCKVNNRNAIVMVQQLAPKGELFDYLMYTKNFPQNQAISLFHQLIKGLQCMHESGIAHRDLKPENLLFDNSYNLKLADFGFSFAFKKGEGAKTAMRTELGTKGYMAPEILSNKKYTEKADIFAAGVILFIMLAGFPPFQNAVAKDWWFDKLQKKKYKLFWMAHERSAKFSPEAKEILQAMLAPTERERLDVMTVQDTDFWKSTCLTKDELVAELKSRKRLVDQKKAEEKMAEGISRDIFGEILIRDDMPKDHPILLREIVKVKFTQDIETKGMQQAFLENFEGAAYEELSQLMNDKSEDDLKAMKDALVEASVHQEPADFLAQVQPVFPIGNEQLAKIVLDKLHMTNVGVVDDLSLLQKLEAMENGIVLPEFQPYKLKAFTYKTQIGLGALGYCCHLFASGGDNEPGKKSGRGKMVILQNPPRVELKLKVQTKRAIPQQVVVDGVEQFDEEGEPVVDWIATTIKTKVHITISMFYDAELETHVIQFENTSADKFGMDEYRTIVHELTGNAQYFLSRLLNGTYDIEECNTQDCDVDDNDVHEEEEEIEGVEA